MRSRSTTRVTLSGNKEADIEALGRLVEAHVAERWQAVLHDNAAKLQSAYERAGDSAYGTYLSLLFRPVHRRLKEAGLRVSPPLPGDFDSSREWGNREETDQQRWMWSAVLTADGGALGTLVTITHHDHSRFRVPRQPGVLALAQTGDEAVVEALSKRSSDFGQALPFTVEYANYLKGLEPAEP